MLEGRGKGILVPYTVACGKGRGSRCLCGDSHSPRSVWKSSFGSFCFLSDGGSASAWGEDTLCKDADARLKMMEQIAGASARLTAETLLLTQGAHGRWELGGG